MKWKIRINRVEYYEMDVVVEAKNLDDAVAKVEKDWNEDDYLYSKTVDCMVDSDTTFWKLGLAKEEDEKYLINIE